MVGAIQPRSQCLVSSKHKSRRGSAIFSSTPRPASYIFKLWQHRVGDLVGILARTYIPIIILNMVSDLGVKCIVV